MTIRIGLIAHDESSLGVRLLHRALAALGHPAAPAEVEAASAGSDTQAKVRALQTYLNVAAHPSLLVDDATEMALYSALSDRGLTVASRSFTVTGSVRRADATPAKRQQLIAFDVDLRGVAAYDTAKTVRDLERHGGFDYLGSTTTDLRGGYSLTFYDWQYRRAERKAADVVVYALAPGKERRLVGHSRIANAEDYGPDGVVKGLDVLVVDAGGTEYAGLMRPLEAFLAESKVSLDEIASSTEALRFAARELDAPEERVRVAASAAALASCDEALSQELLYGIGRRGIALEWSILYGKSRAELQDAILASADQRIIARPDAKALGRFLDAVDEYAIGNVLEGDGEGGSSLKEMLATALPEEAQQRAFVSAVSSFEGSDFGEFWSEHLPAQPGLDGELVGAVLEAQRLSLLTGNNQPLVAALHGQKGVASPEGLVELDRERWLELVQEAGVPEFVEGDTDEERAATYVDAIRSVLDAAFPTPRIGTMIADGDLAIEEKSVARGVHSFLSEAPGFDFASSRVHDFDDEIKGVAGDEFDGVKAELLKLQRIFQVSPSPDAMAALHREDLHSAYTIANIPQKAFLEQYGDALGGTGAAFAIHQRASHVTARNELTAMTMLDYTSDTVPAFAMGGAEAAEALVLLQERLPNYAELFGSPDLCECKHCRSVYSPAAYFVDLLRFLWRGTPNGAGDSPLDVLLARRPDLAYLPLTCENTNTEIPYVDLAAEVMEFYAAHHTLAGFEGHDTEDATAAELRANPQNVDLEAYRNLKDAKYPALLPYHQPLDVIRTYSDHLGVSRYEAMVATTPEPDATSARAIASESLRLAQEEYLIVTAADFDGGAPDATPVHEYYGYTAAADLEGASAVPELLRRLGIHYTELVELVKTRFVNPTQQTLDVLQEIFADVSLDANTLYARLEQIEAGTLDPADDADLVAALDAYNAERGSSVTPAQLGEWIGTNLAGFRAVVTLYEPESRCDLETTSLRTIESIYTGAAASGVSTQTWSRLHRFLRLAKKLGWTIHETDLVLDALGETDIAPTTIAKLEGLTVLRRATKLPLDQLAVLWGPIDAYGGKSLYARLFLNKAVQRIDDAFKPDAWGDLLQDATQTLAAHRSAILAAFRIREDDLAAIYEAASVVDGGAVRTLDPDTDVLHLGNLSTIYRHVVLAKALRMRVPDLCTLIELFGQPVTSIWDVQLAAFTGVDPSATVAFYRLAAATKALGIKAQTLEYAIDGTVPDGSTLGLDRPKALQVATAVRAAFSAIEQQHPEDPGPLTVELLTAKLALTFQPPVVARFAGILDGTATSETVTTANLDVVIPEELAPKYVYTKASGRLSSTGVMTDAERTALKALANTTAAFDAAVDELYADPEDFLADSFDGVFADPAGARTVLLDHPAQAPAATLEQRLAYVYERFVPILKAKLRRDTIAQHIAGLIGLDEDTTAVLIGADVETLIGHVSEKGFTARFFDDVTWTNEVATRTDETVDVDWGTGSPDPAVPANNFSARWAAYVAPPASGAYTLVVDVADADDAFRLFLDDELVLAKASGGANTSWEALVSLNGADLPHMVLDYAETAGDAGVRLRWKTDTTAREPIPAAAAYPAAEIEAFLALVGLYHRAAKFILAFKLTQREVAHLEAFAADFDNFDFKALDATHWQRISAYAGLRDAVSQGQVALTDVFAAANVADPMPAVADLTALLLQATGWDADSVAYLVDVHFGLGAADFRNEVALNQVRKVVEIGVKTGLSAETIVLWGAVETDFDVLHATSQVIKNAVKAKYEEADWLDVAGELSDTIRAHQQDALVAYLLMEPAIRAWGATDADSLFEYFLIDVQMGACMDTSRIVQASAAVQLFVNRCLLNLESETAGGAEVGVSPGAIDTERWQWMKLYRVWEANRKVFLYPENWLAPEWRTDRSEFFRDLESYLVQNDITDSSVEQAFRGYLAAVDDVANLDVSGVCRENFDDGNLKALHVFARTHTGPYRFYYRRWSNYRKWSPWQRVPVDVRGVETGGATDGNSGVQLVPVVWKRRLILFWPEFMRTPQSPAGNSGGSSAEEKSTESLSTLAPDELLEIRLAWSEYVEGKWTPKRVSKEYLREWPSGSRATIEKEFLLTPSIAAGTEELTINVSDTYWNNYRGAFKLADIQAPVRVEHWGDAHYSHHSAYSYAFSKRIAQRRLELLGDVYLAQPTRHALLPLVTYKGVDIALDDPFFFSDAYRTYFVRPVPISVVEWVRKPDYYRPYLPEFDLDKYRGVYVPPVPGPDDYLPVATPIQDAVLPLGPYDDMPFELASTRAEAGGVAQQVRVSGALGREGANLTRDTALRFGGAVSPAVLAEPRRAGAGDGAATYRSHMSYTGRPLAGVSRVGDAIYTHTVRADTGLEFHTYYHPVSHAYTKALNEGGVSRLLESDTTIASDNGATFENAYQPNFANGFVQKPADFPTRTYYKENVCFDVYGANSIYNWELFFHAPLYIATRLSRNGKFEEAMKWFHFIFDPTTDALPGPGESDVSRYWNVLPFKTTPAENLEEWFRNLAPNTDPNTENAIIGEWRDNPFDPHRVAANRPLAYMKHVVIEYVANLVAWADSLFRQFTRESVYEALELYVTANHILGPRPEFVPSRGRVKSETYDSLKARWDDFSNALVELENIFPYSSGTPVADSSHGPALLGLGPTLYFCIPPNDKLLETWDTVADRLHKIRHCQNIEGVEQRLSLFAPPIDPGALVQAAAQGLSLGSILADLSSPPPTHRFTTLIQKANEFCVDVKGLGTALLSALEKRDTEELGRLRASHESQMLELITEVRNRDVLEARANVQNLEKGREAAGFRLAHYIGLLGNETVAVPATPAVSATLTADSQLPADTLIPTIETDVDESLADSAERGVKLLNREKEELDKNEAAKWVTAGAAAGELLAGIFNLFPQIDGEVTPIGVGAGAWWGGQNLGAGTSALSRAAAAVGTFLSQEAQQAATLATFIRREQEWTLQANVAAREIVQLDKQITAASIRVQIAEKELVNHQRQIDNAGQIELFLSDKFTNEELYQWMKEQLFSVYKQAYNLAFDMAKKAEKAYAYELGVDAPGFVQYGYWDNSTQGLVAGERLQLALRQLESAYLDGNRRELELTKSISLARLDPLALIKLRETGRCYVSVPEELFDLDFRGHYFRRIKAMRVSVPSVAGPYTSLSCSLRLLSNSVRVNTSMNGGGTYEHENDQGLPTDDDRFRTSHPPVTSIATSTAQGDSGMFEFNFRDERYLPFERAGAISDWQIELSTEKDLRPFDYDTISDVILHMSYTARSEGGLFKDTATTYIRDFVANTADVEEQPLMQMVSMKHDFPTEWYRFLHPAVAGADQILTFALDADRFPYFVDDRAVVMEIDVFAKSTVATTYDLILSYTAADDTVTVSDEVVVPPKPAYGGLNGATIGVSDAGLQLDELALGKEMQLKLKRAAVGNYHSLVTDPEDELTDVVLVLHYRLA
jgi:hypothetical protein